MKNELTALIIRPFTQADIPPIVAGEIAQGWHASPDKYLARLQDAAQGRCIALCAELDGEPVGYINVYPDCTWGAFGNRGWPEIVDFGVLERVRGRGVGTALMDEAERIAARYADHVYLGVGLHSGYGSAQRMYVRRGYVPDGSGVWYGDRVCEPCAPCVNDDDLVLYLSKRQRPFAFADRGLMLCLLLMCLLGAVASAANYMPLPDPAPVPAVAQVLEYGAVIGLVGYGCRVIARPTWRNRRLDLPTGLWALAAFAGWLVEVFLQPGAWWSPAVSLLMFVQFVTRARFLRDRVALGLSAAALGLHALVTLIMLIL